MPTVCIERQTSGHTRIQGFAACMAIQHRIQGLGLRVHHHKTGVPTVDMFVFHSGCQQEPAKALMHKAAVKPAVPQIRGLGPQQGSDLFHCVLRGIPTSSQT